MPECAALKYVIKLKLVLHTFTRELINHTYLLGNKGEEYKLTVEIIATGRADANKGNDKLHLVPNE